MSLPANTSDTATPTTVQNVGEALSGFKDLRPHVTRDHLRELILLRDAADTANKGTYQTWINRELELFECALKAVNAEPQLQMMFGGDKIWLLADILRAKRAEADLDLMVGKYLPKQKPIVSAFAGRGT